MCVGVGGGVFSPWGCLGCAWGWALVGVCGGDVWSLVGLLGCALVMWAVVFCGWLGGPLAWFAMVGVVRGGVGGLG